MSGGVAKGWRPPERYQNTYRLVFADPEYHGLEVVVRRMSFGAFRAQAGISTFNPEKLVANQLDKADVDRLNRVLAELCDALVSWNLEDPDGNPVPATREGLDSQDLVLALQLLDAWMTAAGQHQAPPRPDPALEAGLPMQPLP